MPIKDSEVKSAFENRFLAIVEQSPFSIQILSPDGFTVRVNKAWEELWGVTLEQIERYNMLEDEQLVKNGIMPYIKSAFAGQFAEIPPFLYDPEETIPGMTSNPEPKRWTRGVIYPIKNSTGEILEVVLMHEDITNQILAEEKVKASEARFRSLMENANDIIYSHDLQGKYLSINNAGEKITGYSQEEILRGMNVAQIVVPKYLQLAKKMMDISERRQKEANEQFLAQASTTLASSLDYETTLSNVARLAVRHFADWCSVDVAGEDGTLKRLAVAHINPEKIAWAHEVYNQYPPDQNEPQGLYNVFRTGESEFYPDIPDQLLMQSARDEEHLEIMRHIGFRSAMIVPLKARDKIMGVLTFVNSEANRHHSVEDLVLAEDLVNRAALAVDNARLYQAEQQIRQSVERTSDLLRRLQSVSESLSQALTPQQVVSAVIEQAVNSLGAHAGTVVLLNDAGTEVEIVDTVNFPQEVVLKWSRFPLSKKVPIADAIRRKSPVILERLAEWSEQYPELGPLASVTGSQGLAAFPLIVEGHTIGALGLSFPVPQRFSENDQAFMLALAQQCAQALERARLYETEQKLRTQAETANSMKDEFLATVSHELRTPLNAILGWSQMLKTGTLDGEGVEKAVTTIERNARAQTQLIDDLLDVSRIITGKLRLDIRGVDLSSIVMAAADAVRPAAEAKEILLQTLLDPQIRQISGDPDRLQQIIWNLLSNAVKFTPHGGSVQIRTERVGSHVEIIVSDNGAGIDEEFLPHVFDRFRQLDGSKTRRHGGLGLGLAIVRQLVELHGGTVFVKNNGDGFGSTFVVKLPILTVQKEQKNDLSRTLPADQNIAVLEGSAELANLHILLVDDEADSLELLSLVLSTYGAVPTTATSAREAFELIQNQRFDVLVCDIGMPEEDGFTLMKKIRDLSPEQAGRIPAIALTAYARTEDCIQALRSGFQMHLSKPVEPSELILAVANLVERMQSLE